MRYMLVMNSGVCRGSTYLQVLALSLIRQDAACQQNIHRAPLLGQELEVTCMLGYGHHLNTVLGQFAAQHLELRALWAAHDEQLHDHFAAAFAQVLGGHPWGLLLV